MDHAKKRSRHVWVFRSWTTRTQWTSSLQVGSVGVIDGVEEEIDWSSSDEEEEEPALATKRYYGFNNQYTDVFMQWPDTLNDLMDEMDDPETCTAASRNAQRIAAEDAKFDPDHYMYTT
jgi:protein SHQ1